MKQAELFSLHREPVAAPPPPRTLTLGEQLKRDGIRRAQWGKEQLLGYAREVAVDICRGVLGARQDGCVTADDVAEVFEKEGLPWLGNAAGALFTSGAFQFTGRREKSRRAHAHANELKLWRLKHN